MGKINDILFQYPEESLQGLITGKIISGSFNWENKPVLLSFEKYESGQVLFSINEKPVRILLDGDYSGDIIFGSENSSFFHNLFWISNIESNKIEIKYLKCGNGQKFNSNFDIGFGDNIISEEVNKKKSISIKDIGESLKNDFVFENDGNDFIFVQTYPGRAEKSYTIYGMLKRADINFIDNKWLIQRTTKKPFPKKHIDFLSLNIAQYKNINIVEASAAKEAYEAIQAEGAKGNTLISLWQTYSALELERANLLKTKIGDLNFSLQRYLPEGITRIKVVNLSEDLKLLINENRDDILNISLELSAKDEEKSENGHHFKIKSINSDYTFDLYDEINELPEKGCLAVSLIGDKIVNKRRERALKSLREDQRFVTRNLLFAIEGVAEAMPVKKRNEKAITERTRKFLKDKFGISDLTQNQKDAVEIAINTPDIAIIQGPPGTGKSTVVAAICDRLIEIDEKANRNDDFEFSSKDKLILVSAFQNDTVEHIASKIFTLGLPTIKIGKETQGNMRAEDKLIQEIKLNIDNSIQKLSAKTSIHRISKKLIDIKSIYEVEKDEYSSKKKIEFIINSTEVSDELWNNWKDLSSDLKFNEAANDKNLVLLKGIRTEIESYNDDGFHKIQRILKSDLPITDIEKKFLETSPVENPSAEFLTRLIQIKERYLEGINKKSNIISSGINMSLVNWLDNAIMHYKALEQASYEDDDTFYIANLESLREELDGNAETVREAIKDYGESLAATNQIAGGREMSYFNVIRNVILEEAARSNPLDLIIPMSKASDRIIMVGDQNQLPHLLEDDIADETATKLSKIFLASETRSKLEESLFGVIFRNLAVANPKRTITLTEQFRMHPFIGDFIGKVYYSGSLKQGMANQADLKKHGLQLNWAKGKVAVFCNVGKSMGTEQSGKSKSRHAEAIKIIKLLDELKTDPAFENLNVGIIAFYAKQVQEIFVEAAKKGYSERKHDGTFEISKQFKETIDGREKLRIGTVDSFQGKEFDIVILSTVRSNDIKRNHENNKKVFGFLTLENRLNVAFSRSQRMLMVVGDGEMFSDEFAQSYVEGLFEFYTNLSTHGEYGSRI